MRIFLSCLIILLTIISAYSISENHLIGFAFINSEIESSPGINIIEDCYNGKDDDGDNFTDTQDSYDCFNIPNRNVTNNNVTNSSIIVP